jgi:site-specific recombinase XerD
LSVREAFLEFEEIHLAGRLYSDKTISGYRWVLHSFVACHGDIDISEINKVTLAKWVGYMHAKGNSPSTVVSHLSRFKVFIAFLVESRPMNIQKQDVYVPPKPKSLPKYVSLKVVQEMLDAAGCIRDQAIIAFLFSTGARNAELRGMKRADVDGLTVFIREGKGLRDRIVYMDARAKRLLDRYLISRVDQSPLLFVSTRGDAIAQSSFRYIIERTAKRAGVGPVHPHMFRHGLATHLMREGMPTRMIQKLLGHSYLATTELYMHVTDSDLRHQHSRIMSAEFGETLDKEA